MKTNTLSRLLITIVFFALVAAGTYTYVHWFSVSEQPAYESTMPTFPQPEDLPPIALADFRYSHPRLPHPSPEDIRLLQTQNPRFLRSHKARAKGGSGAVYSSILTTLVEPGSQDLQTLLAQLLSTDPGYRGNQTGIIALGFDWLYHDWDANQRRSLLEKVVSSCRYNIEVIRRQRLSPYNVFLYNRPLQNLMACALAVYGHGHEADLVMRFTADYWKNRVLPVWRQVMGRNGGWHEGGEYVGIGIGQAIFQLPAMWRHATGEDYLKTEPGIRGFLDFLIYRTRPDGTHFRWGDAAAFRKSTPDRVALALEYRNQPAFSLKGKTHVQPSSWPWGPLSTPELYDPTASRALPLHRFFDGIGLLVVRSDWSDKATYLTFKVGDNFWSHSHLDQGAFTIYKGGALAIDSGLYGPTYGSDHHMNYTYQTVAHNTVTVTDPNDNTPLPTKKDPRRIANDGGQRRVGSGWGLQPAPLDIDEWQAKRQIYHTGSMRKVIAEHDVVVAVGDVTPAYTNSLSGRGTFSDRTRRVERFWRTLAYDRVDDVVLIYDQVTVSQPRFTKRWILHTQHRPMRTAEGFKVEVTPQDKKGKAGGRLAAYVLLPKQRRIDTIGGPGLEFYVDGQNFDERGQLNAPETRRKMQYREPGAWRLEVIPKELSLDDRFLVVLLPTLASDSPSHRIRLLEDKDRTGCEVVGPTRTTRWWFDHKNAGAQIEIKPHRTADTHLLDTRVPLAAGDLIQ